MFLKPSAGQLTKYLLLLSVPVFILSLIFLPIAQTSALSVSSLSEVQGPTVGGNNITVNGTDFIKDEDDEVAKVASGNNFVLALTKAGKVYSWGGNEYGQLGNGDNLDYDVPQNITSMFGTEEVTQVHVGSYYGLALSKTGKLFAWGRNESGQLALGNYTNYNTPQDITTQFGGEEITELSTGYFHVVAMTKSGKIFAWGQGAYGQLGNGVYANYNTLQDITSVFGGNAISKVIAGSNRTFVVTEDDEILACGGNNFGQLGIGDTVSYATFQDITSQFSGETIEKIAIGAYYTIALSSSGEIFAWGDNTYGQLGSGNNTEYHIPQNITAQFSSETVTDIFASYYSSFATSQNNTYAWGYNLYGQLGVGGNTNYNSPRSMGGQVVRMAGGAHYSVGLASDNSVYTWGSNQVGQLGNGETGISQNSPQDITAHFNLGTYPVTQIKSIYFGSSKVETFQVIDANTISLIAPAHNAGFVDVIINDINGRTTILSNGYEYITIGTPNTGERI